jgi:hypothetical protein
MGGRGEVGRSEREIKSGGDTVRAEIERNRVAKTNAIDVCNMYRVWQNLCLRLSFCLYAYVCEHA